jgi:hypothetical protein
MKTRQLVFSLAGIVGLIVAFEIGLHLQIPHPPNPNNRLITITASPEAGKCGVDFPVAVLHYNQNQSVQWRSNDNKYWISFLTVETPPTPPYVPENPLVPQHEPVVVEPHGTSRMFHVKEKEKYYMYAIFDHDPATNGKNPCKAATDDRDTGLNIKPQ